MALCAILIAWDPSATLLDGFEHARGLLRLRRCRSYQGFVKARARWGVRLIALVRVQLAALLQEQHD